MSANPESLAPRPVRGRAPSVTSDRWATSWLARAVAVVLLVAGGLAYADWVLQLFLPVRADVMTSFISELGAVGQPHHELFRAADVTGGALSAAGGVAAWLYTRRWAATWSALILLGACVILESILPLGETLTFAAVLPKAGTHLWWKRVSEPHGVVSFLETVSFLVLFLSCTAALRRATTREGWRRLLASLGLAAVACGIADAALTASLLMSGHASVLGLVQRIEVTLTALWLAAAPTWLVTVTGRTHATQRDAEKVLTSSSEPSERASVPATQRRG